MKSTEKNKIANMSFVNKLFKTKNENGKAVKPITQKNSEAEKTKAISGIEAKKPAAIFPPKADQPRAEKSSILISQVATEKAVSGQGLNKYIFKVAPLANKIEIAKAVGKNYNVKAVSVNIINVAGKKRRVGKTLGFKSGFKKAVITLAEGQSIEVK